MGSLVWIIGRTGINGSDDEIHWISYGGQFFSSGEAGIHSTREMTCIAMSCSLLLSRLLPSNVAKLLSATLLTLLASRWIEA